MRLLLLILCSALVISGCNLDRPQPTWPPSGNASATRSVVVVDADAGPVAAAWDGAGVDLADRLARKLDGDGWTAWRSASAVSAPVLARVTVLSLRHLDQPGNPMLEATVRVQAFDAGGKELFTVTSVGSVIREDSAKLMQPSNRSECRAAQAALARGGESLRQWLLHRPDREESTPAPPAAGLVRIQVASEPAGADVLVDGRFVGSTPCFLDLAPTEVTVRIERAGRTTWERRVTPATNLRIAPVLDPQVK